MNQARQACDEDDSPVFPSVPLQRGARLRLMVIAYNLGNPCWRLVLPKKIEKWSLTSLPQQLIKTDGRLIKHARYYWLFLAESHLTGRLFVAMLRRIAGLLLPAG